MAEVIFKEDELKSRLAEWQKILRLQDWIIDVSICRERDMRLSDNCGECEWNLYKKMAWIRILDPVDYPPDSMKPQDMELTLVHELLHLHLAPLDDDKKDIAIEQAIEAISGGLVDVHRKEVRV